MDEARSGPGLESGSGAMGDGMGATQSGASANPGLKQQAMDSVRGAREQVMTQVRDRAGTAREGATRLVDERAKNLAGSVHALATAFEAAAASLTEGNQARLAELTRELSGRAHRIASYLEEKDTRGLMTDLEGTARQHPAAFLGTTFAAGLAAGRFLRSSTATDTGVPATTEQGVDFEFRPDAALLADDAAGYSSSGSTGPTGETFGSRIGESESDTGYRAGGSTGGYGNPGSGYGATGSSLGATRTGPGDAGFGPTRTESGADELRAGGHIGTGGAAMASRAAGSAPIGSGTGGLQGGGSIGNDLDSTDRNDESSTPQRPTGGEGGL